MPEPEPELLGEEGEEAGEEEEVEEFEDVDDVADTPNEKLLRTSRIDMMTQPESYRNNTQKEETPGCTSSSHASYSEDYTLALPLTVSSAARLRPARVGCRSRAAARARPAAS